MHAAGQIAARRQTIKENQMSLTEGVNKTVEFLAKQGMAELKITLVKYKGDGLNTNTWPKLVEHYSYVYCCRS